MIRCFILAHSFRHTNITDSSHSAQKVVLLYLRRHHGGLRRKSVPALCDPSGFTLIDLLAAAAVIAVLAATVGPTLGSSMRLYALNTSAQTVAAAIRSARYTAVSKNRTVRVRFNCPAANQFRVVEVVGTSAVDAAADRCSEDVYPYPDTDTAAAPNTDGPVETLPNGSQFGELQNLEIDPTGRMTPLTGCPACAAAAPPAAVVIGNGVETRTITITAHGQVQLP